jgi:hypothetical protein
MLVMTMKSKRRTLLSVLSIGLIVSLVGGVCKA